MTEQELLAELSLGKEVKCKYRGKDGVLTYRTERTALLQIGKAYLVALGGSLIKFDKLEF